MKSILHALYHSDFFVDECLPLTPEMKAAWQLAETKQTALLAALTPGQDDLLEELLDALALAHSHCEKQSFSRGFQLGTLVMIEVLTGASCDSSKVYQPFEKPSV